MGFKISDYALVNKFVPKNKFYEKANLNTKLKKEFSEKIKKIVWKYKLAEDTVNIEKTKSTEEIEIFEIELKEKKIPKNVLYVIDKSIHYKILYKFIYENNFSYGIALKYGKDIKNYYFSEWNKDINLKFEGKNLQIVYQNIIKYFIGRKTNYSFNDLIEWDNKVKKIKKEIEILKNKIKKEKQFNRKVDYNRKLIQKKKELEKLLKS